MWRLSCSKGIGGNLVFRSARQRSLHVGVFCGVVAAVVAFLLTAAGAFDAAEMRLLDRRYRDQRPRTLPREIAIVGLEADELRRFSPYPREVLAKIIRRLYSYGARVIVLDVLLDTLRPSTESAEDLELIDAMSQAGNVVLPVAIEDGHAIEPHSLFRGVAAGVGHSHGEHSPSDRVVRWFKPMMLPSDASRQVPSTSLVAWNLWKGTRTALPQFNSYDEVLRAFALPLDGQGQLHIHFVPPQRLAIHPARELIGGKLPMEWFRDRVVFVGGTAEALRDRHRDPFTPSDELGTPGVVIQAEAFATLLARRKLHDAPWSQQMLALIAVTVAFGIALFLLPPRAMIPIVFPMVLALEAGVYLVSQRLFDQANLVIAEMPFLVALLLCGVFTVIARFVVLDRAARHVRSTLSRYMHLHVIDEILERADPNELMTPQRRTVTILFSDLRDYTRTTAHQSPEEIVAMLNFCFTLLSKEVLDRGGYIDKYIGDGMLAVFEMFSDDDGALRAVEAAVAMRDAVAHARESNALHCKLGIGIHTGEVVAGDMGSTRRREYTVIGADVNLASRVEGETKELNAEVLATEATYRRIADRVEAMDRGEHVIRGFEDRKVRLFEILGLRNPTDAVKERAS